MMSRSRWGAMTLQPYVKHADPPADGARTQRNYESGDPKTKAVLLMLRSRHDGDANRADDICM